MDNVIAGMILGMVFSWAVMGIIIAIGYRKPKPDEIIRELEKALAKSKDTLKGK